MSAPVTDAIEAIAPRRRVAPAMDAQHKAVRDHRLGRELIFVLALKAALLYGLWFAFFRQPVAPGLSAEDISRSFLNPSAAAGERPFNSSKQDKSP